MRAGITLSVIFAPNESFRTVKRGVRGKEKAPEARENLGGL
jgi:hypothetical protein